jgi:thioredoxin reductase (NADPH)
MTTTPEPEPLKETPDLCGAYPRLSPEQIQALAALGERRETQAGDVGYQAGDTSCDFFVILDGKIAIVEGHGTDDERIVAGHGPGRFVGELGLLTGQPCSSAPSHGSRAPSSASRPTACAILSPTTARWAT